MSRPAESVKAPEKSDTFLNWLGMIRLFLVAIWFGAAVFFSFGLAPSAFAVLSSREMAGLMVQRTLGFINVSGFIIGLVALLTLLPFRSVLRAFEYWAQAALLIVFGAACALGHWVIAARMHVLRSQLGLPIDLVPPTDATRLAFNQLHEYSVATLTAGMVAALAAWILIALRTKIVRFHK